MFSDGLGKQVRSLIAKVDGAVQAVYDDAGQPFRPRFFPAVQHLIDNGEATITELAAAAGVSQPASTQTINEMTKLGLVASRKAVDGRERSIVLTSRGIDVAERLRPIWDAVARAADELDRELPQPLSKVLAFALDALDREPFTERIRRNLNNG
jgi:DNA-binding MarR family transcriptional regulator